MSNRVSDTGIQANRSFGKALIRAHLNPSFAPLPVTRAMRLGVAGGENSLALFRGGKCCSTAPLVRLEDTFRLSDVDVANTSIRLEDQIVRPSFPNAAIRSVWDIALASRRVHVGSVWAIADWMWKDAMFLDTCHVSFYRGKVGDYFPSDIAKVSGPTALLDLAFVQRFTCYAAFAKAINARAAMIALGLLTR